MGAFIAAITAAWRWFIGKRTYIIAGVAALYALTQYWQGNIDLNQLLATLAAASAASTTRSAIAKTDAKITAKLGDC